MAVGFAASGDARVLLLGVGHTVAYTVGAVVLSVQLRRRLGPSLWPAATLRMLLPAAIGGLLAWSVQRWLPIGDGRAGDLLTAGSGAVAGAVVVLGGYRFLHLDGVLTARMPVAPVEPA